VTRFEEVLELSILGEEDPEVSAWPVTSEREVEAFTIRRRKNPNHRPVLFDFVERLEPDTVVVSKHKSGETCPFNAKAKVTNGALDFGHPTFPKERFQCAGAEWNFVGVTVLEDQDWRPRRCLWAHPVSGGLSVKFSGVKMGRVLEGHSALPYWVERWKKGARVTIEALVDGKSLGRTEHDDGDGFRPFSFSTEEFAGSERSVEFLVRSKSTSKRDFCFEAVTRD
jgi:hypothetical protein